MLTTGVGSDPTTAELTVIVGAVPRRLWASDLTAVRLSKQMKTTKKTAAEMLDEESRYFEINSTITSADPVKFSCVVSFACYDT